MKPVKFLPLVALLLFIFSSVFATEMVTPFPQKPYDSDPSRYPIIASLQEGQTGTMRGNYFVGYIDSSGMIIIPPSIPKRYFGLGKQFFDGFRTISVLQDDKWVKGFMNTSGVFAFEPRYDWVNRFSEGFAAVRKEMGGNWSLINTNGEEVLSFPAEIRTVSWFKNGRARYREGELYGFVDIKGNKVIPAKYIDAGIFSEGVAWVNDGTPCWIGAHNDEGGFARRGLTGMTRAELFASLLKDEIPHCRHRLIDLEGRNLTELDFKEVKPASEGLLAVNIGGVFKPFKEGPYEKAQWGYIDTKGKWIIPSNYIEAGSFRNGLAPVRMENGKYGYINKTGKIAIPSQFDLAKEFSEGLAAVVKGGKSFYINIRGDQAFSGEFRSCSSFVGELGFVVLRTVDGETKYAYINQSGKIVFSFTKDSLVPLPRVNFHD